MKTKKVLFLVSSGFNYASSRVRVYQYLPYLLNINFKVFRFNKKLTGTKFDHYFNIFTLIVCALFYDTIFIQKVFLRKEIIFLIKYVFRKRIVYDYDDAIFLKSSGETQNKKIIKYFNYALTCSDACFVVSNFNADYARKYCKNVHKIVGPIDVNRYKIKFGEAENTETVHIGWIGSPSTTKYLNTITLVFEDIKRKYKDKVKFAFMGADSHITDFKDAEFHTWNYEDEIFFLMKLDIGIMPLSDDNWVKGKGGYKLLQYMATGIPSVASDIGMNSEIIVDGETGFLVDDIENWIEKLSFLIENPSKRKEFGKNARLRAEKCYSIEANIEVLTAQL